LTASALLTNENQKMPLIRKILLGLSLLTVVNMSFAGVITLQGDHFSLSYDEALVDPRYKQALLAGSQNTVYFQPTAFSALSGGSPASTQALLQLTFTVNPGYAFTGLSFAERGDYFLLDGAGVDVAASVQAVNVATSASTVLNLSPGSPLSQTGGSTAWELTGNLLLQGLGSPQTMLVTLDNTLFANAPAGSLGFIQKTYAGFRIATAATTPAAVPEPSSVALLAVGLMAALLAGVRRRTARV
jgi:hypothetical protein